MFPIQEIEPAQQAFPGDVSSLMPAWEELPVEFKTGTSKWHKLFNDWFFFGLKMLEITPKEGVDKEKALIHLAVVMKSWQPKHEHKTAACAFLCNEWFEDATWVRHESI